MALFNDVKKLKCFIGFSCKKRFCYLFQSIRGLPYGRNNNQQRLAGVSSDNIANVFNSVYAAYTGSSKLEHFHNIGYFEKNFRVAKIGLAPIPALFIRSASQVGTGVFFLFTHFRFLWRRLLCHSLVLFVTTASSPLAQSVLLVQYLISVQKGLMSRDKKKLPKGLQ
jgi:hypothetical protein